MPSSRGDEWATAWAWGGYRGGVEGDREKGPVVHLSKRRDIISIKLARLDPTLEITYKVKRLAGECSLRPVTKCKWRCIRRSARHGGMARKTRSANCQDIQLDDTVA